jgi:hypothetical protein
MKIIALGSNHSVPSSTCLSMHSPTKPSETGWVILTQQTIKLRDYEENGQYQG